MTLQMRGAAATHTGQIRKANQDRAMFSPYIGAVADGMGGHQGGEQAASIVVRTLIEVEETLSRSALVDVVSHANRLVYEESARPELRGMGTTVVAVALNPDGTHVNMVNVGDSRGYRYANGELEQITFDHSLVEELVREGRISPEEALVHPQRNIVTRAIGLADDVEADVFELSATPGDRFVLCSDGLSNEIDNDEIVAILEQNEDPIAASDALVLTAVERGGRDNVSVVVVDIVDDEEPEAALTMPEDQELVDPEPLESLPITQRVPVIKDASTPSRREIGFGLAVVTLLFLGYLGVGWYGSSTYFVGTVSESETSELLIFKGRPDGVLWVDPEPTCSTGILGSQLDDASSERLNRTPLWGSRGDAESFVDNFELADPSVVPDPSTDPPPCNQGA